MNSSLLIRIKEELKSKFDLIANDRLKINILNALPYWVSALICGSVAVLYARLFSLAEKGTHYIYQHANWVFFILTPACFVVALWVVSKFSPFSKGSGIPQVTAAIELSNPKHYIKVDKLLSWRVICVKITSSLIMVFGGGVVGREGPTIQISASIFKKINDLLPPWYPKISKRNMIVTGAAAGLAAAFNTPLGGIVFAIEELTKTHFSFFKSALLTGVIIAGLTALHFQGPYLYIGYPPLDGITAWIIIAIIPVAIITGLAGSGVGNSIVYILNRKKTLKKNAQKIIYAAIGGLVIAALAYFIDDHVFGSGKEIMVNALFTNEKHLEWYVPILRMAGQVISFTAGSAGGIFGPSLSAGASIGAVVAGWFHLSYAETNLLILCGMTGFLTSITKSPFTSTILVLEMTNSHNVIFYILLAALFSNIFGNAVSRHSIYDHLKVECLHDIQKAEA